MDSIQETIQKAQEEGESGLYSRNCNQRLDSALKQLLLSDDQEVMRQAVDIAYSLVNKVEIIEE